MFLLVEVSHSVHVSDTDMIITSDRDFSLKVEYTSELKGLPFINQKLKKKERPTSKE